LFAILFAVLFAVLFATLFAVCQICEERLDLVEFFSAAIEW
jgi:hypothetical protein